MAIRWLAMVWVATVWLSSAETVAANPQFLEHNCERNHNACVSKCVPEIKMVPGKDGTFVPKADGRKATQCKLKCVSAQNKCKAAAAKATPPPARSCTTNAQCATGEGCFENRCVAQ